MMSLTSANKLYEVKIIRLPLPIGPLGQGYPEPKRRPISLEPAKFSTEAEALRYGLTLQHEGYGAAVIDPDGNEYITIKERAVQLFTTERASLMAQLEAFQTTHSPTASVAAIQGKIAELDNYLRTL